MSLVEHARREMELLGEDPIMIEGMIKVVQAFADMGHSGGSAAVFIPMLNDLLRFKNLKPLTDDPKEWMKVSDTDTLWQSTRRADAFSQDGGKTYYLLDEGANFNNPQPVHHSEKANEERD